MTGGGYAGLIGSVFVFGASGVAAQQQDCQLYIERVGHELRSVQVPGGHHQFAGGGVRARCAGKSQTMEADSVAWYSDRGRMDFVGGARGVRFRDSTVQLDAQRASYFTGDERLDAAGSVRLVNLRTGSVLTGPNLTYHRAVPGIRDSSSIFATGRPLVEYRSAGDPAEPYLIRSDRFRLAGEGGGAWAGGRVEIERRDFRATSDSAALNSDRGQGFLIGTAQAMGRDSAGYRLRGGEIEFRLTDNRLSWLQARGGANAESSEWTVVGDTIEFELANDLVQGGGAWGDSTRATATSTRHTIVADSLAIDTPDQVLTEVRGYGAARAVTGDSTMAELDWLAGDTLVAQFDSTEAGGRGLSILAATGRARAFYHIYPTGERTGPPGINYARGGRITVRFTGEELDRVDIVDAADGVYLEPPGARRP